MTAECSRNVFAQFLKERGTYVITVEDVDWYDHGGYMVPAYLPHCCPKITPEMARKVVKISGKAFAKWDTSLGRVENSEWWYIIRRGPWSLEQCSGNTRSKIRRGRKHLYARALTLEEVMKSGYEICNKAAERYDKREFVPPQKIFERKIEAAAKVDGVLEFFGVFCGNDLVGYSENYIQNDAVFWESIWYDPEYLPKYSSYVLTDEMLNYYLNNRKLLYVSDGSRSIYHKTNVQEFFVEVFGFTKEYAILNIVYSPKFLIAVNAAYFFKNIIWGLNNKFTSSIMDKAGGILQQEFIRRDCLKL